MVENLYIGRNPKGATELIEKFNANPDSNSGVLTQPKVINEKVTIPAGRVGILADTEIAPSGEIVIEAGAELFIPSGTTISYIHDIQMPKGLISLWYGSTIAIPAGWLLCDGDNGTPDLRDRFIVGAGSTYDVGVTGGSKDAVVVAHTHTGSTNNTGAHSHTIQSVSSGSGNGRARLGEAAFLSTTTSSAGAHSHTVSINQTGSSGTNANLPPYYALAYIMKI